MITYSILAGVMQYIGLIVILWGAFLIYAIIRSIRNKDYVPLYIAVGIPIAIAIANSDTIAGYIIALLAIAFVILQLFKGLFNHKKDDSQNNQPL